MINKSILISIFTLCVITSGSLNAEAAEIKEIRQVGFNVPQWWNGINTLLNAANPELANVVKVLLNNTNSQANEFISILNRTNPKAYNQLKQSVDIAKAILGINGTSLAEIAKAVQTFPNDPVQLTLRVVSVVFAKELKQADQEVVRRLTNAINNIQDPNLKQLAQYIASNPVLVERVFGKGITQEPVTRLVFFLSRVI